MGTPNEETWPGVTSLKDYKSTFPNWSAQSIEKVVSGLNLDLAGLDLLKVKYKKKFLKKEIYIYIYIYHFLD